MKPTIMLLLAFALCKANAQTNSANIIIAKTSSNTKYIDASQFFPFINGKAIVVKGAAYGVIDSAGNFIIPYNKYKLISYAGKNLLDVSNGNSDLILNNKGAVLADCGALHKKFYYVTTEGDYVFLRLNGAKNFTLIDGAGKSYAITENKLPNGKYLEFSSMSEQAIIMKATGPMGTTYGFKGLNNQLLAEPVLAMLFPFKGGFAVYGQPDNYGVLKYGIISITGKKTTEAIFSNAPMNLGSGYFRAEAASDADFYYAIINGKGDIIFKETKARPLTCDFRYYEDGYFFGNHKVMDIAGHVMTEKDLITKAGFNSKQYEFIAFMPYAENTSLKFANTDICTNDGFLAFQYMQNRSIKLGLLNVKTNQIVLGSFSNESPLSYDYIYDPAAQMLMVSQDGNQNAPATIGFMAANGNIKIVQAEKKSGW